MAPDHLTAYPPQYPRPDREATRQLLSRLRHLPEEGEMADGCGLLRREIRYICPAGHVNAAEAEFCTHSGCGLNIYGLTQEQEQAVDDFEKRVEALAALLGEI